MNREIKFRAKRKLNGTWVYGNLTKHQTEEDLDYISEQDYHEYPFEPYIVITKTIGQYTGLKDKNGKEIYEGDVIRVPDDYDTFGLMACEVREVYFLDGGFRLKPKDFKSRGHWMEDNGVFEVIGNIYENPELLK